MALDPLDSERLRSSIGRFVRRIREADGMPAGHPAVLAQLADGPRSITDLAARAEVKHQSMARTVKLLGTQGLVVISTDPADRRRVVVEITALGAERLAVERSQRADRIAHAAAAALTDEELAILARVPEILDKLASAEADAEG